MSSVHSEANIKIGGNFSANNHFLARWLNFGGVYIMSRTKCQPSLYYENKVVFKTTCHFVFWIKWEIHTDKNLKIWYENILYVKITKNRSRTEYIFVYNRKHACFWKNVRVLRFVWILFQFILFLNMRMARIWVWGTFFNLV